MQYETRLEELRRLRKDSKALKGKKGLAEHAIVRRIHFIYERATRKFRGDLRLWSAWLDFCKETSSKRKLSQVHISGAKHSCPVHSLSSSYKDDIAMIAEHGKCSALVPLPA